MQARVYDDKVREFVRNIGIENIGKRLVNSKEGSVRKSFKTAATVVLQGAS